MERTDELKKDFKEALAKIDFKEYDPFSHAFLKAVNIGQLWLAVCCLDCDDDVAEEIDGAKKYLAMYEDTKDSSYKDMARDELRHAGILIKKHYAHADSAEKIILEKHENERQEILKGIEKEGGEE